jgi:hypothetical protein
MRGAVTVLSSTRVLRHRRRWPVPIDEQGSRGESAPETAVLPYAFAAGLCATFLGTLMSVFIPGRGFLIVWAAVSLAVAVAAGWEADRMHAMAVRVVARLSRAE